MSFMGLVILIMSVDPNENLAIVIIVFFVCWEFIMVLACKMIVKGEKNVLFIMRKTTHRP